MQKISSYHSCYFIRPGMKSDVEEATTVLDESMQYTSCAHRDESTVAKMRNIYVREFF